MREQYDIIEVAPAELSLKALEMSRDNARLGQICAVRVEGGYELFYSFIKEYKMINLKVCVPEDVEITSISDYFPSAMLYENEMAELFGVKIKCISLDYKGKFYRIEAETPFK